MLKNVVVCSDFPQIHVVAIPPHDGFVYFDVADLVTIIQVDINFKDFFLKVHLTELFLDRERP